jgi:hypothetical protein
VTDDEKRSPRLLADRLVNMIRPVVMDCEFVAKGLRVPNRGF